MFRSKGFSVPLYPYTDTVCGNHQSRERTITRMLYWVMTILDTQIDADSTGHWAALVGRFRQSCNLRASWQLTNTLLPYAAVWYAMYRLSLVSWWFVPPCAVLAAALLVRLFIIFHDCGHGSFFSNRRANAIVGFITGTLTFVPTRYWWAEHAKHHAAAGNLDKRG